MRIPRLLIAIAILILLFVVASFFVTTIPPSAMTHTAITETQVRIHIYMLEHREYPPNLAVLSKRDGYMNRTTDGWGHPLLYAVDDDGIISLSSLGCDGKSGGTGDDQDVIRRYRTRNDDGTLNIDDELWTVRSEIKDSQ